MRGLSLNFVRIICLTKMVQCTYLDKKVCTSSISYGSFEEGFDHVAVDFFPTFDEQLEFIGFLFDQVLCFGRILGQVVEFPLF